MALTPAEVQALNKRAMVVFHKLEAIVEEQREDFAIMLIDRLEVLLADLEASQ